MEASRVSKLATLEVIARRLFTDLIRKGKSREEALKKVWEDVVMEIPEKEAIQLEREAKIVDLRDY
jgi:hypothetical protein